jgi:hypothetical protein
MMTVVDASADLVIKIATLVISTVLGCLAIYRYTVEQRKWRQDAAREKFDNYLDETSKNAAFIMDFWRQREIHSPSRIVEYKLFVDRTLWACEEAILAYSSPDWIACIDNQLVYHEHYFRSPDFEKTVAALHPKLRTRLVELGYLRKDGASAP